MQNRVEYTYNTKEKKMKRKDGFAAVVIVLGVMACVSYAGAATQVLINDTFDGSVNTGIETLGWTLPYPGAIAITDSVIDSGNSAGSQDGGWVSASKDFTSRVLAADETAVLTWTGKTNLSSNWMFGAIMPSAPDNARSYEMYKGYGYYHFKVYVPVGSNPGVYNAADIATSASTSKFKIELSQAAQKFYYDEGAGWVLAMTADRAAGGGLLNAGVVSIGGQGYPGYWLDSINYQIVPTTVDELCPNVYVHMLRYSSSLFIGAIWPAAIGSATPPQTYDIAVKDSSGQTVLSRTITGIEAMSGTTIPVSLPGGKYRISVTAHFSNGASNVALDRDWLYTPTPVDPVASLRNDGAYLVNGTPYFPLGLYHVKSVDLAAIASSGINMAMSQVGTPFPSSWYRPGVGDDNGYSEKCAANGTKCLAMGAGYLDPSNSLGQSLLNYYRNDASIALWIVYDEPSRSMLGTCQTYYEQGVNWDPTHPFFTLQVPPSPSYRAEELQDIVNYFAVTAQTADIFSVDPYPIDFGQPLRHVYDSVDRAVKSVFGKKPVWATLQSYTIKNKSDGSFGNPRLPTSAELKCMSYMALAAGARGLLYYAFDDTYWTSDDGTRTGVNLKNDCPDYWNNAFTPCISQIKANSAIWTAPYASGSPINQSSTILMQKKPYTLNNRVYMLVVNPENTTQGVNITLPIAWSGSSSAPDVLGGTSASISSGILTDSLAPLQAKCYELKLTIGASGKSLRDPLMNTVAGSYNWALWGAVKNVIDPNTFTMADGSGVIVKVSKIGHGYLGGECVTARGSLNMSTNPPTLTASEVVKNN